MADQLVLAEALAMPQEDRSGLPGREERVMPPMVEKPDEEVRGDGIPRGDGP